MKIAVTGKGGVGKTTVSAILAGLYAAEGHTVLAIDADPDANFGSALGYSDKDLDSIVPISEMKELIRERTGADEYSKIFRINPKVDDLPDALALRKGNLRLLVLGTVDTAGSGCVCPEHVLLKRLLSNIVLQRDDVVIMDMEAGLEHLGRGTTSGMDGFVVVVEPGERSIKTLSKIRELAEQLNVKKLFVIGNKIRTPEDEAFIRARIPESELAGLLWFSDVAAQADREGKSVYESCPELREGVKKIKEEMEL